METPIAILVKEFLMWNDLLPTRYAELLS